MNKSIKEKPLLSTQASRLNEDVTNFCFIIHYGRKLFALHTIYANFKSVYVKTLADYDNLTTNKS
ncbi:CLUMA_CG001482, isoform A [Clunio marinus]|uniref:CLUMA_CG001482, isoform A n=1 Tax=Clunio marinus TaxID=568069 RepID=A0A1J1HIG1_9DIPT|nr:CLUMA_CG001482, isoform A [Clunio marinus]